MADVILETRKLSKEFRGFTAVSEVDLRVERAHIHALIGPNGAGKTTCFNLLTRFLAPTRGQIFFNGRDITAARPAQVARMGIIRSFQISAVFPHLTALENVRVGLQRRLGTGFHFWKSGRSLDSLNARALALLAEVGLESFADAPTADLPYGRKRALEIATTLAMEPELMLLDEPTQGGPRRCPQGHGLDPQGGAWTHHPDGRAQYAGRRRPVRPHFRAPARRRAGRRQLRRSVAQQAGNGSVHGRA